MDTATRLAKFADSLDGAQLVSIADGVDRVLSSLSKVAQYVGVQGYWVRNQRCWSNCYRQKRSSNPSKDAQSIWFECQEEYQDSINKDTSDWDKYASDDAGFVKTAALQQTDARFASALSAEMNNGKDAGTAAFDIMSKVADYASHHYVEAAGQMLRIAEVLEDADPLLAAEAGSISGHLVKEAQAINNIKGLGNQISNWFRGRNDPSKFNKGNMLSLVSQLDNTLQGYIQQKNKITQMLQGVRNGPAQPIAQQMSQLLRGVLSQQTIKKLKGLAGEFDKNASPQQAPASPADPNGTGPGADMGDTGADDPFANNVEDRVGGPMGNQPSAPISAPEVAPESDWLKSIKDGIDEPAASTVAPSTDNPSKNPYAGKRFYKGQWVPEDQVPAEETARMDSPVSHTPAVAPKPPRKRRPAVAPQPAVVGAAKHQLFKLSEAL